MMCTFILGWLPAGADIQKVRSLADAQRLGWRALDNRFLQSQVEPDSGWFLTARKHCDCGTSLGSIGSDSEELVDDPQLEVPSLRKRGWSEARIARWLSQKTTAQTRRQAARTQHTDEPAPDIEDWIGFLRAVLKAGVSSRVGVFIHWFSGNVAGGRIKIVRRDRGAISRADVQFLRTMQQDVLYEFEAG